MSIFNSMRFLQNSLWMVVVYICHAKTELGGLHLAKIVFHALKYVRAV